MNLLRKTKWIANVLAIPSFFLVGICGLCVCEHPYHTNPNLRLLVGDTTTKYDSLHCSNPVVSPDGQVIYYLCVDADSCSPLGGVVGAIYAINDDGTDGRRVLDGKFDALSIAHDGMKLAVHNNKGGYPNPEPESLILVIDLDTLGVSHVDSFWTVHKGAGRIEWSQNDQYLYFAGIFRLNLLTAVEEVVGIFPGIAGFDLFRNDSLYLDSLMMFPQLDPQDEKFVIGTKYEFDQKLLMRDLDTSELDTLPDSLIPYVWGAIGYPYWFPDGNTIVFAAQPYVEGSGAPAEIWILENLFEQIGE